MSGASGEESGSFARSDLGCGWVRSQGRGLFHISRLSQIPPSALPRLPLSRMLTFGAGESGVGWFGEDAGYV